MQHELRTRSQHDPVLCCSLASEVALIGDWPSRCRNRSVGTLYLMTLSIARYMQHEVSSSRLQTLTGDPFLEHWVCFSRKHLCPWKAGAKVCRTSDVSCESCKEPIKRRAVKAQYGTAKHAKHMDWTCHASESPKYNISAQQKHLH